MAALEHWVLRLPWRRVWLARLAALAALYIAAQTVLQLATGRNLQGYGRWGDGELTGPFEHPRAGAPLTRLLFPAVLPAMARLGRWYGLLLLVASVLVVVLIGQRMPLLLTGLGPAGHRRCCCRGCGPACWRPAPGPRCCWRSPPWWCRRPSTA